MEIGLISNPHNKAKALFRRSKARRHVGKFADALEDIRVAASLKPNDEMIQADVLETERLLVLSKEEMVAYIAGQPQAPPLMSFTKSLAISSQLDLGYIKLPPSMDMRAVAPPTF
jgi:hypothetical protein